ncbi:MAG: PHP domain-containing protein, partial [Candidatus Subteraquimicrobiales bacterium]|nr:PHP domain-containing protein [Candidatus Subteraquimicrobiales bacterium]
MTIDLHLHSTASDGTLTPEEIVRLAFQLNLKAVALADHDSIDGVSLAIQEGKCLGTEVVPAVELSSDLHGRDIHLLGYYIDYNEPWFKTHLKELKESRLKRAVKMVEKLKEAGLIIAFKDVLDAAKNGAVGRAHIARVMIKQGYIDSIEEAFEKYIGRKAPYYVEKYSYSPEEVIEFIRKAKGIAVLAHPGLSNVD